MVNIILSFIASIETARKAKSKRAVLPSSNTHTSFNYQSIRLSLICEVRCALPNFTGTYCSRFFMY